jgi:hypothetical protein
MYKSGQCRYYDGFLRIRQPLKIIKLQARSASDGICQPRHIKKIGLLALAAADRPFLNLGWKQQLYNFNAIVMVEFACCMAGQV